MKLSNFIAKLFLLSLCFLTIDVFGQDPSQVNWPYWHNEFMDFSGTTPNYEYNGAVNDFFANISAYSDENGVQQISVSQRVSPYLGYTPGGKFVVNFNGHEIDIIGAGVESQSLVLPHPNSSIDEYFVFSVGSSNPDLDKPHPGLLVRSGTYYSIIRGSGTNSLNIPLRILSPATSDYPPLTTPNLEGYRSMGAITATPHCLGGGGYYIFVMGREGRLAIFNLKYTGIIEPVQEINLNNLSGNVDIRHSDYVEYTITVSPKGDKIAISTYFHIPFGYFSNINIFDMDLSNPLNPIAHNRTIYNTGNQNSTYVDRSIAFTPSGRYLYYVSSANFHGTNEPSGIWRLDLNTNNNQYEEIYRPSRGNYMDGIILGKDGNIYGIWNDDRVECDEYPYNGYPYSNTVRAHNLFTIENPESASPIFNLLQSTLQCRQLYTSSHLEGDGRVPHFINAPAPDRDINTNFDILCPNGDCEILCGSNVTYRLSAFSGAYDYVWKVDNVTVANNVNYYTHTWTGTGQTSS